MNKPFRFSALALLTLAALTACGGGDDGDTSTDVVAPYIGSWGGTCYPYQGTASAQLQLDFIKTSATSFNGDVVVRVYVGTSCSGLSVASEDVFTNMQMAHAGSTLVAGVAADRFAGTASEGTAKIVLSAGASSLKMGDPTSAKDADGYPTAFYSYAFTRR